MSDMKGAMGDRKRINRRCESPASENVEKALVLKQNAKCGRPDDRGRVWVKGGSGMGQGGVKEGSGRGSSAAILLKKRWFSLQNTAYAICS